MSARSFSEGISENFYNQPQLLSRLRLINFINMSLIHLVLGLIPGLGTVGVPSLSKREEEKRSGLSTLVHIQCGVTMKYCKSPKNSIYKKNICSCDLAWLGLTLSSSCLLDAAAISACFTLFPPYCSPWFSYTFSQAYTFPSTLCVIFRIFLLYYCLNEPPHKFVSSSGQLFSRHFKGIFIMYCKYIRILTTTLLTCQNVCL